MSSAKTRRSVSRAVLATSANVSRYAVNTIYARAPPQTEGYVRSPEISCQPPP